MQIHQPALEPDSGVVSSSIAISEMQRLMHIADEVNEELEGGDAV